MWYRRDENRCRLGKNGPPIKFLQIGVSRMQSTLFRLSRLISKPLSFSCLLFLVLAAAILLAPLSTATREAATQEDKAALSQKRRRPEFVPGEALVRFKQNRAFEGTASLPVPNADASIRSSGKSVALAQSQE